MITIVTTTRNRPLCFNILEQWINNQTVKPDQWIVVNDGTEDYTYNLGQEVILRDPSEDELPSICENWLAAIPKVKGDKVIVAEDDDYYHPEYIKTMCNLLDEVELGGVNLDVYYKLPTQRFMRMGNVNHASLAATAFRCNVLSHVERCCKVFKNVFIDMYLWAEYGTEDYFPGTTKLISQPLKNKRMLHVGFKHMPGEKGLGIGHRQPNEGSRDGGWGVLREWLAGDYRVYYDLHRRLYEKGVV